MPFDPLQPYDDLPDLPPAADVESKTVLKACIDARAALAGALNCAADWIGIADQAAGFDWREI